MHVWRQATAKIGMERPTTSQQWRLSAGGCYRGVQCLLDSGVFMRPEFGKRRERRWVYLVVTDAREPVAAPVNRKAPLVETWWMHAKV